MTIQDNLRAKDRFLDLLKKSEGREVRLAGLYPDVARLDEILAQVRDLKQCLESFRPLDGAGVAKLEKYFDEVFTYDSTTIEGNTLTLQETSLVINKGVTIGGKSLQEHLEVVNHVEAIEYIRDLARNTVPFSQKVLLDIHALIMKSIDSANAGKYRNVEVMISGSRHKPPSFFKVQELMDGYFRYYQENKNQQEPVVLAAQMHEKLVTIHPFVDGNGRTSRLVMNLILLQHGYPITNISSQSELRADYYTNLETVQTQKGSEMFVTFIANNVKKALIQYVELLAVNDEKDGKGKYFYERYLELKGEF